MTKALAAAARQHGLIASDNAAARRRSGKHCATGSRPVYIPCHPMDGGSAEAFRPTEIFRNVSGH